ncbi:S-adenosyl-L-methionine-dependent tRNA 4-demethylwyosine synthase TYW1 [Halotydeus destructor]|nr:S-adenosyl-L-methionine-dependent tRNA 4-demethylwyosine synthase TYW1 [Halotydeus destructor]
MVHDLLSFLKRNSILINATLGGAITGYYTWKLLQNNGNNGNTLPPAATEAKKEACSSCVCSKPCNKSPDEAVVSEMVIVYASDTGNSKRLATQFYNVVSQKDLECRLVDITNFDPEENLVDVLKKQKLICIFVFSTYDDGGPSDGAKWFCKWLEEASNDFRVERTLLKNLLYAVFGVGDSNYGDNYCLVGKNVDKWLNSVGAGRMAPIGFGDGSVSQTLEEQFSQWSSQLTSRLFTQENTESTSKSCCTDDQDAGECQDSCSESDEDEGDEQPAEDLVDIEDLVLTNGAKASSDIIPEMITPQLRKELTKQGYKLIGSHSGVKLCRWTKSMLRGRGGCYKHTFYGIESHRCMEATPSLACANKCVFCWRHHSNPVGTEWKWQMDNPEIIVEDAIKFHTRMINEFKGVSGVVPERLAEGMEPRHCALSLVGEPIMYPEINTLITLLHARNISTFLVTNAQFPDAIKSLHPVTQLYVSIDASSKESLKKIDRPLFKDFWQRFLDSLTALSDKGQRTVYRLTLVKSWNAEEIEGYGRLVDLGKPDFIEIKGVTYCGTSDKKKENLTMQNVPWHEEVVSFVQKLTDTYLSDNYEIVSEHEHSNCVLVAHKKFKVDGKWMTWIDYDKFQQLVKKYYASNGQETFTSLDYMARLPDWAVYGSQEQGFDPEETRFRRKTKAER